uniref:SH3 domain-containing protein n=1 Tax=Pararhizobium sp. IMCC3301 TaxID=3067904 RepID=UPI00274260F5|nr:SH3 domain-containing protein [Pararhizobium sp. IMCC3301]
MSLKVMQLRQTLHKQFRQKILGGFQQALPGCLPKWLPRCLLRGVWLIAALLALSAAGFVQQPAFAQSIGERGIRVGPSGLALPRFVSLKSNQVNVRVGPGREYDIAWIFVKGGLPVEVFQESDNWRRIRDASGNSGWVFHSLLSGRRTALVTPWASAAEPLPLYRERSPGAKLNARLETGVLLSIDECDGVWCRADLRDSSNQSFRGYVQQNKLWGVYPNEEFED